MRHLPTSFRPRADALFLLIAAASGLLGCTRAHPVPSPELWFVDAAASGTGDGRTWVDAFPGLQQALAAADHGDRIWVARGRYTPGPGPSREASFRLRDGVAVYGGFAGFESELEERDWLANETVLDGDLAGDDGPDFTARSDNAYQVVVAIDVGPETVLDGFTIRGGHADGIALGAVPESRDQGAGINVYDGAPAIRNCTLRDNFNDNHGAVNDHGEETVVLSCLFQGNRSLALGAGLYVHHHSRTLAIGCTFEDNQTEGNGGGAYSRSEHGAMFVDCTFTGNRAQLGGGFYHAEMSETHVDGCVFEENLASVGGGGLYANLAMGTITGCTFSGNVSGLEVKGGGGGGGGSGGGGIWCSGGSVAITDCDFDHNAASFGGGIYNNDFSLASITGCTFTANTAFEAGGLYALSSDVTAVDCTFTDNVASGGDFSVGGAVSYYFADAVIRRSTFDGNQAELGGGGLYTEGEDAVIEACTFTRNRALGPVQGWGGGILVGYFGRPSVTDCEFVGNRARLGGGFFHLIFAEGTLVNASFAANEAEEGGAVYAWTDSDLRIDNGILWGDLPDEIAGPGATLRYSCVAGGAPGEGNQAFDPRYRIAPGPGPDRTWGTADDVLGDLALEGGSPCIDAGDNASVPAGVEQDIDGEARFQDDPAVPDSGLGRAPVVDLGAHEG